MSSSVANFFVDAVSNTYNETVEFWSEEGSINNGIDAVVWSAENPEVVAVATAKGVNKGAQELQSALMYDAFKMLVIVSVVYFIFIKVTGAMKGGISGAVSS